jgi:dephospho-CoA kinase
MPITDKLEYADQVIDNSGGPNELAPQVDAVIRGLHRDVGWTWRLDMFPLFGLLSAVTTLFWRRVKYARRMKRRGRRNSGT